ncbi:MAG: DMT family transporter [Pseudomonadales bacterium]
MSSTKNLIPLLVASLGIACFASMDAVMKSLAIELGAYNAMIWRTPISVGLSAALFFGMRLAWPTPAALRLHVLRGVLTTIMGFLFFWGLIYVPLAEAVALSFIAPLIALYLAAALLKEAIGLAALLASLLGFAGALIIVFGQLSGNFGSDMTYGIAAILCSAVLYAYNLILQRQQALLAKPAEIALFQNSTVCLVLLCVAPWFAVTPSTSYLPEIALAAILSTGALMILAWAYARAEAKVLIPVEYTAFVWAALLGLWFFNEQMTGSTLLGTALIVAACLLASRQAPQRVEHVETTAL